MVRWKRCRELVELEPWNVYANIYDFESFDSWQHYYTLSAIPLTPWI